MGIQRSPLVISLFQGLRSGTQWPVLGVIIGLLVMSIALASCAGSPQATPNGPVEHGAQATFAILAPATVRPHVGECHETLAFGNDGAAGPLFCRHGQINANAWAFYAKMDGPRAPILSLGRNATLTEIKLAVCTPEPGSNPMAADEYALSKAYYGLRNNFDALQWISRGNCIPPQDRG